PPIIPRLRRFIIVTLVRAANLTPNPSPCHGEGHYRARPHCPARASGGTLRALILNRTELIPMPRLLTFVLLICVVSLLAGCASLPFIPQPAAPPPPPLDPELLTVSPYPTSAPQPTYTPYPTAERLPSRTPFPTFPPRI